MQYCTECNAIEQGTVTKYDEFHSDTELIVIGYNEADGVSKLSGTRIKLTQVEALERFHMKFVRFVNQTMKLSQTLMKMLTKTNHMLPYTIYLEFQ